MDLEVFKQKEKFACLFKSAESLSGTFLRVM